MTKRLFLILPLAILLGCAAKPVITSLVEPLPAEGARIDERTGAVTIEKRGVAISLKPLDTSELLALTDDPDINPFIEKSFWGKVRPLYAVFDMVVRNKSKNKVVVDPFAVLITENGDQYGSLPYEYFKDILGTVVGEKVVVYVPVRYRWWYDPYLDVWYYRPFWRPYWRHWWYERCYLRRVTYEEARMLRLVARQTIFDGAKLFPGAKRRGLIVFERLPEEVREFKVVIPEVRIYRRGAKRPERIDFEFKFRRRSLVK